jgi:predicted DNA binding CopG/RHH family protein
MEKREKTIPVRVSLEEEKTLIEKANKVGLKLSTYLRLAALEKQ